MGKKKDEYPEHWERLAEWLVSSPRVPSTQKELASQLGINEDSIKRIKRNPRFRELQQQVAAEHNISPERIQDVLESLFKAAKDDWRAAQAYLGYCDRFLPELKKPVTEDVDTKSLSDAELMERIKRLMEDEEFNTYDAHERS